MGIRGHTLRSGYRVESRGQEESPLSVTLYSQECWGRGCTLQSGWAQCSPPQGPARAVAGGRAARSPGCATLDPPQLPAGAAQWPPGPAQGAGRPPCGGLCSHGPGDGEGGPAEDAGSAGLGPRRRTSYSVTPRSHMSLLTSPRSPLQGHIPHTPLGPTRAPSTSHTAAPPQTQPVGLPTSHCSLSATSHPICTFQARPLPSC